MVTGMILAKPALLRLAGGENNLLNVVLLVVLGATIYGSVVLILQRDLLPESIRLVKAAVGGNPRLAFRRR